ncbi:hypothetical protein ACFL0Q_08955 [Thermodesulfobacteriota bacterium]
MFLTLVVILYGAYSYFFEGIGEDIAADAQQEIETLQQTLGEAQKLALSLKQPLMVSYILSRAEAQWSADPFYEGPKVDVAQLQEIQEFDVDFLYTGYLQVGARWLAVINGIEYEIGEPMEPPEYVLRSVDPKQVVIEHKGTRRTIEVPYEEERF